MQKLMKSGPGDSPRAGSGASKDAGDFGVQASEQNNAEIEYLRRAQVFFFFFQIRQSIFLWISFKLNVKIIK